LDVSVHHVAVKVPDLGRATVRSGEIDCSTNKNSPWPSQRTSRQGMLPWRCTITVRWITPR